MVERSLKYLVLRVVVWFFWHHLNNMVLIIISFYSDIRWLLFTRAVPTHLILNPKILGDLFRSPIAVLEYMIISKFVRIVLK